MTESRLERVESMQLKHNDRSAIRNSWASARRLGHQLIYTVIALVLSVTHLLLPIERGFPLVRLANIPFTLTLLVSGITFIVVLIDSGGKILYRLPMPYLVGQVLMTVALFASALVARDTIAGFFVVLSYFATFVLDFLIVYYLFQRGFRRTFVLTVCAVLTVAVILGISEGLFRAYLPVYQEWFLGYDSAAMNYAMMRVDFRALGTLGNPILYAVAMALGVPFVLEIRRRLIRYTLLFGLFLASMLAISTTAVLVWGVLGIGIAVISRHRLRLLFVLILMVGVGMWAKASLSDDDVTNIDTTMQRLITGNPDNINTRQQLLEQTLLIFNKEQSPIVVLFGHGLKSAAEVAQSLSLTSILAIDNMYATLLYETGLVGLMAFGLMGANLIVGLRRFARVSLFWYTALSLFVICVTFDAIYYSTFNFLWVASVAVLVFEAQTQPDSTSVEKYRLTITNLSS